MNNLKVMKNEVCVVGVILNEENQALIVKRGPTAPWEPNKWSLVGGGVEAGENLEEALRREVKEETQMTLSNIMPLDEIIADWGLLFVFTALSRDKPVLNYENTEYCWIREQDILKFNYVPDAKEILCSVL